MTKNYTQMTLTPKRTIDLLADDLRQRGYSVDFFELHKTQYARFTAPNGNVWLTSVAPVRYPFVGSSSSAVSDHKNQAYALAAQHGVTVPFTQVVTEQTKAEFDTAAMLAQAPLIVKPNHASLSAGLTLAITTEQQLNTAIDNALTVCPSVLVQKQIEGEEIRFIVIHNKVTGAILRRTPRVVGDGVSTVATLIEQENQLRAQITLPYVTYPPLDEKIISLSPELLTRVPQKDEIVELGRGTMIRNGASMYSILKDIHPSYVNTVESLAHSLGSGFVVVDMFVADYTVAQSKTNYALIELNKSPVLHMCYGMRAGEQYDVIADLAPAVDVAITGGK